MFVVDEKEGQTLAFLVENQSVSAEHGSSRRYTPSGRGLQNTQGVDEIRLRTRRKIGKGARHDVRGGKMLKLTFMWEDGICSSVKATTAEIIVGNRGRVAHEDGLEGTMGTRQLGQRSWGVFWRKNEHDLETDGEKLQGEVVMMDQEYEDQLEGAEESVQYAESAGLIRIHCAMFQMSASLLRRTARQADTKEGQKRMETALKDTVKAEGGPENERRSAWTEFKRKAEDEDEESRLKKT